MTDKIVPAALKLWLVFLLVLIVLGYSVVTSILFGAIGGFAGGMVTAWWKTKGGEPRTPQIAQRVDKMKQRIRKTGERIPLSRLNRLFPWSNRDAS